MFTGLIEAIGHVSDVKPTTAGFRLRLRTALAGALAIGDSLAVNGVCLTVTRSEGGEVHVDIGPETSRLTTLGALQCGQPVNLERALQSGDRLGGHFVQGHVDGIGTIQALRDEDDVHWLTVRYPKDLAPYLVRKGSIGVDGVSLTVAGLDATTFDVMIVPFTWAHTTLSGRGIDDPVNLESDIIGKYVARAVETLGAGLKL